MTDPVDTYHETLAALFVTMGIQLNYVGHL